MPEPYTSLNIDLGRITGNRWASLFISLKVHESGETILDLYAVEKDRRRSGVVVSLPEESVEQLRQVLDQAHELTLGAHTRAKAQAAASAESEAALPEPQTLPKEPTIEPKEPTIEPKEPTIEVCSQCGTRKRRSDQQFCPQCGGAFPKG